MSFFEPILKDFPHILHGGDYNPDQWLHSPETIDEDFRLMKLAGCNSFSVGIFAWSQLEPREGEFTFDWLDRLLDRMADQGMNAILATPSGAKPLWMSEKYPEVRRVGRDRRREPSGTRHNHCWSSPVFRAKIGEINRRLAERYGAHPAVKMWHVSNELGGDCYCDLCMRGFHEWLEKRYGNLQALNQAYWSAFWSHQYSRWDEVDPRDGTIDASGLDWRRYEAELFVDYFRHEIKPLREFAPKVPITTNHMGTHRTNDYDLLRPEIDVVSQDMYPGYCSDHPDLIQMASASSLELDFIRCVGGVPRRWFTMESALDARGLWGGRFGLKPDGVHGLEMLQHLAHGSEGTLYFQWRKGRGGAEKFHSAVVSHTGGERTRVFGEAQKWSARHSKLDQVLGSLNRSEVALVYDIETSWAADSSDFQRARDQWGMGSRFYLQHLNEWGRPFWDRGIGVDVVGYGADWTRYKLIAAPLAYLIDEKRATKFKNFVAGGGTLIATYYCGIVGETGLCHIDSSPGGNLDRLFGVWSEEFDLLRPETALRGSAKTPGLGLEPSLETRFINGHLHARDAEVLAVHDDGLFAGKPLLTRRRVGGGAAWYLGSMVDARSLSSIVGAVCREAGVQGWLKDCEPLPEGVTVQTRRASDKTWRFLLNFTPQEKRLPLGGRELTDIETGKALRDEVVLGPWGNMACVEE
jgi:beta-galactosidase